MQSSGMVLGAYKWLDLTKKLTPYEQPKPNSEHVSITLIRWGSLRPIIKIKTPCTDVLPEDPETGTHSRHWIRRIDLLPYVKGGVF